MSNLLMDISVPLSIEKHGNDRPPYGHVLGSTAKLMTRFLLWGFAQQKAIAEGRRYNAMQLLTLGAEYKNPRRTRSAQRFVKILLELELVERVVELSDDGQPMTLINQYRLTPIFIELATKTMIPVGFQVVSYAGQVVATLSTMESAKACKTQSDRIRPIYAMSDGTGECRS